MRTALPRTARTMQMISWIDKYVCDFYMFHCQAIVGCTKHSPDKKFSQPLMFEESTPNRQVHALGKQVHYCIARYV